MPKPEPKFEDAMAELERIVTELERGELPLDKALEAYEKGAGLVKQCHKRLADAELRVEKIMQTQTANAGSDSQQTATDVSIQPLSTEDL